MEPTLLTSTEVAAILGVTATTVKRWADAGLLRCVKTAGSHRRFERAEVDRFRSRPAREAERAVDSVVEEWLAQLLVPRPVEALAGGLLAARGRLGSWWRVAEEIGEALAALGDRWASGQLSVLDEHLASERLARSLARLCEWLPTSPEAPRSLLVTAVGDDHTIGLSLVELCLREAGWATLWGGRRTPSPEVARAIELHRVRLVVVSASSASTDGRALAEQAGLLGQSCRLHGARLIVGGRGAWPHRLAYGEVIRDFATLHEWAERRGPGGAPATGSSP